MIGLARFGDVGIAQLDKVTRDGAAALRRDPSRTTAMAKPGLDSKTDRPHFIRSFTSSKGIACAVNALVGAARLQLARDVSHDGERRTHRARSEADARDAERLEIRNRRRALDGEDVDRSANALHQLRDGVAIAHAGHEHAIRARGEKGAAALDRHAQPRLGRAERAQEHVGARVDHDADAGRRRRLGDRLDLVHLQRDRLELGSRPGTKSSMLMPTAPAAITRSTTSATASGVVP